LSIKASTLEVERDRLVGQVSSLEGTCFRLRDEVSGYKLFKKQIKVVQDEQVRVVSEKVAGLDSELMGPDVAGPSQPVGTELSADSFYVSQDMDSEMLRQIYVPKWDILNESTLDDFDMCCSLVYHLAPSICLSAKVRMRLEHTLREKKILEGRFNRKVVLLKEMDAEIASLKAQLSLREAEAAEAIRLRGQIAIVEAARVGELDGLKEQNVALEGQVVAFDFTNATKGTELASLTAQTAKLT
nr:hypothetical protein [Tanacetum cinerariifolium]